MASLDTLSGLLWLQSVAQSIEIRPPAPMLLHLFPKQIGCSGGVDLSNGRGEPAQRHPHAQRTL